MISGDLNVDPNKPREARTQKIIDDYKTLGLHSLIKGVTCHHNDSESCVDHIVVNRDEMVQLHGIISLYANEHTLVYVVRKQPKIKHSHRFIWARSFRNFNPFLFEWDILFVDWSDVLAEQDVKLSWANFSDKLNLLMDNHAPFKKTRVSDSMPKWVTMEFIAVCDECDHHYRRYAKNKSEENK